MERLILLAPPTGDALEPSILRCRFNPDAIEIGTATDLVVRPSGVLSPSQATTLNMGQAGPAQTTMTLHLLFEAASLTGEMPEDVRTQTALLHNLGRRGAAWPFEPPQEIDLIWGKHWSARGVMARVAERLDHFTNAGIATRSWLTLELQAVSMNVVRSLTSQVTS